MPVVKEIIPIKKCIILESIWGCKRSIPMSQDQSHQDQMPRCSKNTAQVGVKNQSINRMNYM